MGMLAYGAMSGVGDEYLKQSAETRQAGFQEIRDKRLSELKKGEQTQKAGLDEKSAKSQRDYESKNYSFGYGESVVRDGEVVQTGGDRPLAGSTKAPTGNLITMNNGDQQTEEQIRKTYQDLYKANTDEFGNRIGDFDLPTYDDWRNERVAAQHRINPDTGKPEGPVEPTTAAMEQARTEYNDKSSYTESDQSQFGMSEDEWVQKRAQEIMQETGPKPTSKLVPGKDDKEDGMLTEGLEEKPAAALKQPLSLAAKTDPTQMYDELMAQNFDEQTVIDTIRQHFQDPTWEVPANALM